MITLKQFATLVKDRLAGGDSGLDHAIDERDIMRYGRGLMNQMLKVQFYQNMQQGDRQNIPMYLATYNSVAVAAEGVTGKKCAVLPERFLTMPYSKGVHHVAPMADLSKDIIRNNNYYVSRNLDLAYFEGNPSYYIEGLKLYFSERNWISGWTSVQIILLIGAPDSITESDILPLLPDQETEIINAATQYFSDQKIMDTLNDGNPDRGVTKQAD